MIIRKIYHGTIPIRRVYLGSRKVWWIVYASYTRGTALAALATDAGAYMARASPAGGQLKASCYGSASAYTELMTPVLLLCTGESMTDVRGAAIPVVNSRGSSAAKLSGYASPITYGIVWARGGVHGESDARGSPKTAGVAYAAGYNIMTIDGGGDGRPGGAETIPSAGTASGELLSHAGAQTREPERIRMSACGTMTGSAGAVTAKAERTAGQAVSHLTAKQAGAMNAEPELTITLVAAENGGNVYLLIDSTDNPLENVSDPEKSGEDNTYIIQII